MVLATLFTIVKKGPTSQNFTARGFSLIEIMLVVSIISLLAAVAMPQYQRLAWKTMRVEGLIMAKSVSVAEQAYFAMADEFAPGGGCASTACTYGDILGKVTPALKRIGLEPNSITKHGYRLEAFVIYAQGWCPHAFHLSQIKSQCYGFRLHKDLDLDPTEPAYPNNTDWLMVYQNTYMSAGNNQGIPTIYRDDITNKIAQTIYHP